jgi:hypothetical protein
MVGRAEQRSVFRRTTVMLFRGLAFNRTRQSSPLPCPINWRRDGRSPLGGRRCAFPPYHPGDQRCSTSEVPICQFPNVGLVQHIGFVQGLYAAVRRAEQRSAFRRTTVMLFRGLAFNAEGLCSFRVLTAGEEIDAGCLAEGAALFRPTAPGDQSCSSSQFRTVTVQGILSRSLSSSRPPPEVRDRRMRRRNPR